MCLELPALELVEKLRDDVLPALMHKEYPASLELPALEFVEKLRGEVVPALMHKE